MYRKVNSGLFSRRAWFTKGNFWYLNFNKNKVLRFDWIQLWLFCFYCSKYLIMSNQNISSTVLLWHQWRCHNGITNKIQERGNANWTDFKLFFGSVFAADKYVDQKPFLLLRHLSYLNTTFFTKHFCASSATFVSWSKHTKKSMQS